MRNNENIFVLSAVLFVITAVVAVMLAFSNMITVDKIAENTLKAQNEAMALVMEEASEFKFDKSFYDGIVKKVYKAVSGEKELGWCVSVAPVGYGGEIELIVGIDNEYNLTGIKVVNMSETPGLGAKASEDKFTSQFAGKKAANGINVIKSGTPKDDEILAISGATVTSQAIKNGVNAAIEAVKGGIN